RRSFDLSVGIQIDQGKLWLRQRLASCLESSEQPQEGFGTASAKEVWKQNAEIMNNLNKTAFVTTLLLGLSSLASISAMASIVDLTTTGASGSIGDAFFQQTGPQPTGTGVIDPFLRLQANGNEAGYNTSASGAVFNDKTGTWTHDLLLSSLKV